MVVSLVSEFRSGCWASYRFVNLFLKICEKIEIKLAEFAGKFRVYSVPNIMNITYGRGVGYNIEQLELSKELQEVSATKIRDGQIGQDGKPLGKRPE